MPRWFAALLSFACCLVAARALAVPVRVRGGAQLRAQARFVGDDPLLELRGQVSDDAFVPIEGAWVELTSASGLAVADAGGCPFPRVSVKPLPRDAKAGLSVQSAGGGEFCLRWREAPAKGKMQLRFAGDDFHAAAELELDFDQSRSQKLATLLRFDPRPISVDLDKPEVAFTLLLDLATSSYVLREGLRIELFDEQGNSLGKQRVAGDGKARVTVPSARLGGPGQGVIVARFAGNQQLDAASDRQSVTRYAAVSLAVLEPPEPVHAGDQAKLSIGVTTKHGPVDAGVVEALHEGSSLGSATVENGRAELEVLIDPRIREGPVPVTLRYLAATPWYQPGAPTTVELPIAPPSMLLRAALIIVVLVAAGWVFISWRRKRKLPSAVTSPPTLTPGVHVIHSQRGNKSWKGTVVDAHDLVALSGVKVVVRAPTLEGDGVIHESVTDAYGKFAFDLGQRPEGAEILASSSTHAEERKELPAGGTLRIALVTRRRSLLRRLVSWARVRGKPFDAQPEPTPAHVRRASDRDDVRDWAADVEAAAFGPAPVDERVETRIRDKEPTP